jgi:hypothetical protein
MKPQLTMGAMSFTVVKDLEGDCMSGLRFLMAVAKFFIRHRPPRLCHIKSIADIKKKYGMSIIGNKKQADEN